MVAQNNEKYKRRITGNERYYTNSPYSTVTMVLRIVGSVSKETLTNAVLKVQQRHSLLRVRIVNDENHIPWFTSEDVKEIPIQIVNRESKDQWIDEFTEASKIPYDFENRPPIKFVLIHSAEISELIILCHHIICDGMSLAFLARDIMEFLGDPNKTVEILPDPMPITKENLPDEVATPSLLAKIYGKINAKWKLEEIFFDKQDYHAINEVYWKNYNHKTISVELTKAEKIGRASCRERV